MSDQPRGTPRLALVFCVHHKPWLIQSTLISLALQDTQGFDLIFLVQEGDGRDVRRPRFQDLYDEYYALARNLGVNDHLDPFQPAVLEACKIANPRVRFIALENDHSLDSGAWLKFIKARYWQAYDYVWFIGEGGIFTRESTVSDALSFMRERSAHFLTAGHQKRRIPKKKFVDELFPVDSKPALKPMYEFHQRMIQRTFAIFRTDPAFDVLYQSWGSDIPFETQHHVPDVFGPGSYWLRLYAHFFPNPKHLTPGTFRTWTRVMVSKLGPTLSRLDRWISRGRSFKEGDTVHVNQLPRSRSEVAHIETCGRTNFHAETVPEWFGCACTHLVSREFLEKLDSKMTRFQMYDVIDLPFAASALEVVWAFMPAWLAVPKHFHDGIHRVVKHFRNLRREDDPEGMCRYLNRYYAGRLVVAPGADGRFLVILSSRQKTPILARALNSRYFPMKSLDFFPA